METELKELNKFVDQRDRITSIMDGFELKLGGFSPAAIFTKKSDIMYYLPGIIGQENFSKILRVTQCLMLESLKEKKEEIEVKISQFRVVKEENL